MELTGKRYLVTGGAGFIGSHIAEEIANQGKEVIILDNFAAGKRENIADWWNSETCTLINADVADFKGIVSAFDGVDMVFHNAASKCTVCKADPHKDLMVNAWGSHNVFEAARRAGVKKIIHASTGSTLKGRPRSFYGTSKLAGEAYLGAFKDYFAETFRYTVLRYYHVYGTRQDSSAVGGVIPIFIKNILHDEPIIIFGDGRQQRHFTHVADVVQANLLAAESDATDGKYYDTVSDVQITILELALTLYRIMNKRPVIRYSSRKPGDIKYFTINNQTLKDAGMTFNADFEESLKETIEWYRGRV